jgi:hypothetical protein
MYPQVVPYRTRQAEYWDTVTPDKFVADFMVARNRKRPDNRPDTIRFSESGDFRTQADVDKMERIAELLSDEGIWCYVYTARSDLDYSKVRYLTMMFSGFDGKSAGTHGQFNAVADISDKPDGFGVCPGDCTTCIRCVMGLNSVVLLH